MIIVDTNVLSELMRHEPDPSVVGWVKAQATTSLFATTITQAEILYGIRLLPHSKRRAEIEEAAREMFQADFTGRVLPFDGDAAQAYAEIVVARREEGRPISQFDAQIAAISFSRNSIVATRNISDFEGCGIQLIDPWDA
ncbi:MAG: type II toxin-antitoxin system VapC family toxin [Rhodospirillales bacterium]|nr:type II toxin-antitoxin system VapC family toxin [Rhodospirillales bacterium]MBT4039006.1 type II toxin-antitoxin system VapC family toxin [Rhodospirillales bacterium]MBT4628176.1 type II toxin-antitoxin system VapC family toxin [Rhodospirillales bacterium]MBT5353454.1 type II toxin-antitoxin system VapC family toxin [Rhodospirillales bacterium]MBT5522154.1 type II toxin-antitoxin system VapC family toxin [Rhodospirillales bacterium]